jgi:hypothetical protein
VGAIVVVIRTTRASDEGGDSIPKVRHAAIPTTIAPIIPTTAKTPIAIGVRGTGRFGGMVGLRSVSAIKHLISPLLRWAGQCLKLQLNPFELFLKGFGFVPFTLGQPFANPLPISHLRHMGNNPVDFGFHYLINHNLVVALHGRGKP